MIAFVCQHLNQVILDFNVSNLQTTHKDATKPTDDVESEQTHSDDGNNKGSIQKRN